MVPFRAPLSVRLVRVIALVVLVTVLAPIAHSRPPVIFPGGFKDFHNPASERVIPDQIVGEIEFFPPPPLGIAAADQETVPLSSLAIAYGPIARARGTVLQSNDFIVPADPTDGTAARPLWAQFSGTVFIRGFMVVSGIGQSSFSVDLEIFDVSDDPDNRHPENIVFAENLAQYKSMTQADVGLELSVGVQLGSATIGQVGVDGAASFSIPLCKEVVRDQKNFGCQALLRRGRRYRVQLVANAQVKLGLQGGVAISSFYSPLAAPPNGLTNPTLVSVPPSLIDPQTWLDTLDFAFLDDPLQSLVFPTVGNPAFTVPGFSVPVIGSIGVPTTSISSPIQSLFAGSSTTSGMLLAQGLPLTPRAVIGDLLAITLPDEELLQPGVDLRRLSVTIEVDQTELLNTKIEELERVVRTPPVVRRLPWWR